MKTVEVHKLALDQVVPYADVVYAVDGIPCMVPLMAINVHRKGDVVIVELPNTEAGTERRLYSDQHLEVTVERTTIIPDDDGVLRMDEEDWTVTSDALMLLAESHERKGKPSRALRNALRTWQYFMDAPSAQLEVSIRRLPDRG
jgi:hypothetical protein